MIFRVRPGEVVPVDGTVIAGSGEVSERRFSGLARSRVRGMETTVFAGSLILSGELDCQALGAFDDATITMTEGYLPKPFSSLEPSAEASSSMGDQFCLAFQLPLQGFLGMSVELRSLTLLELSPLFCL